MQKEKLKDMMASIIEVDVINIKDDMIVFTFMFKDEDLTKSQELIYTPEQFTTFVYRTSALVYMNKNDLTKSELEFLWDANVLAYNKRSEGRSIFQLNNYYPNEPDNTRE